MKCPKCGSTSLFTTDMNNIYFDKPGPDRNDASCSDCSWKGKAHEAGAPLIQPVSRESFMSIREEGVMCINTQAIKDE